MNYTVWKLDNFSASQILRETNFQMLGVQKTAIFVVPKALIPIFGQFQPSKIAKNHQNQTTERQKCQKGNFWHSCNPKNLVHVKSDCQKNSEISTL